MRDTSGAKATCGLLILLPLSAQGTLDLINRIQKISAAMVREGVIKAKPGGEPAEKVN